MNSSKKGFLWAFFVSFVVCAALMFPILCYENSEEDRKCSAYSDYTYNGMIAFVVSFNVALAASFPCAHYFCDASPVPPASPVPRVVASRASPPKFEYPPLLKQFRAV